MPIRMVEDDPGGNRNSGNNPRRRRSNGGTRGGILGKLLPVLIPFILKRPKLLIIGIIIFGVVYFMRGGCTKDATSGNNAFNQGFSTGGTFDQKIYDEAYVYEPLADNRKNPLPEKISLEKYCPPRLNQGRQGSCVAWASAYAARTILESQRSGKNPKDVAFSPAYLYNQIKLPNCQGSYITRAMDKMLNQGLVLFNHFAYDEADCSRQPGNDLKTMASNFKIHGFNRLTDKEDSYTANMLAIKQNLSQGSPVVIGMMVGGTFMRAMQGKKVWHPTQSDYGMRGFGGHAMCVIGYDDYLEGGSFQIMNSWGEEWGEKGLGWVRYTDFKHFNKEAYGLFPMGNSNIRKQTKFSVDFGLVNQSTKRSIPLKSMGKGYFETRKPIRKGDKFKIAFTNNVACYTYVFGQDTDGSSYVLFPYTKKHSPYCGITGTRLFPRDFSMQADNIGSKDYMAILIAKDPIDFQVLNQKINTHKKGDYTAKIRTALAGQIYEDVYFKPGDNISFQSDAGNKNMILMVLGISKQ